LVEAAQTDPDVHIRAFALCMLAKLGRAHAHFDLCARALAHDHELDSDGWAAPAAEAAAIAVGSCGGQEALSILVHAHLHAPTEQIAKATERAIAPLVLDPRARSEQEAAALANELGRESSDSWSG
jgi:hypothetical protein